ncbi:c-type cytochrome domain-containing protein [Roseiconus sp. JC912]
MLKRFAFLAAGICSAATGYGKDVPDKVTFEEHVKPIFRQHCLNCHHQGDKKGGLALDTFGSVVEGGGSGEVVYDDGDLEGSRLWQLVSHADTPIMPPNQDKLPEPQLAIIKAWIEGGILENSGSKAKKKKANALAFVASTGGKPDGPAAMPESTPLATPVVTDRAAAITAIAASPWAPLVAIAGQQQIVMYHSDSGELLGILPFEEGIAQDLKFSRDGSYLIAGGGEHSLKGLVAIYNVKTGERVASVGDELDVVFGADANDAMSRVALGGPQKMLRIFDATNGEMLFDLKKHTDWIYSVAYSPDGILVASGDRSGGLCVWEADTGRLYLDLTGHKGAIHSLAWRDDSNVLASASEDGTVKLWEMEGGKALRTINAHGGGVTSVKFDHQGQLATSGADRRAKLWAADGKELKNLQHGGEPMLEVAITHDGKRLVYGNWAGEVFNTPVDDPNAMMPLAANPPATSQRLESAKTTLVSVQQKLEPVKAELNQALSGLEAAKKPLAELDQKIATLRQQAAESEAAAKAAEQAIAKINEQIPVASNQSRDLQDQMIALRVAVAADSTKAIALAEAEETLAAKLLESAKLRRQHAAQQQAVGEHRKKAADQVAQAEQLSTTRGPFEEAIQKAQAVVNAAQKNHDAVAAEAEEVQSKIDRLMASVN